MTARSGSTPFVHRRTLLGWGEALRATTAFEYYDILLHFLIPLLGAPVVYVALARLDTLPDPADAADTRRHLAGSSS